MSCLLSCSIDMACTRRSSISHHAEVWEVVKDCSNLVVEGVAARGQPHGEDTHGVPPLSQMNIVCFCNSSSSLICQYKLERLALRKQVLAASTCCHTCHGAGMGVAVR